MWVSAMPSWNTYSPGTRNRRRLSMISKDKAKSERDQNREFLKIADKVAIVWAAGNATSNVGKNGFTDVTDSMAVVRSSTLSLVSTFFTPTVNKITPLRPFSSSDQVWNNEGHETINLSLHDYCEIMKYITTKCLPN